MYQPKPSLVSINLSAKTVSSDQAPVSVLRPFFIAGIVTVLSVGCLLGAIALFGIAARGSYVASEWTPYVLAHANSQLFGWVGFFIMGFAMQQHGTSLARQRSFEAVATGALVSMGLGIGLRFIAEPLAKSDPAVGVPLGVVSGLLQVVAVALFVYNTSVNRYRKPGPLTWPTAFVFGSLGCLVLVTLAEPVVFVMSHQAQAQDSILFVARWFTPLREVQFLGFVSMMVFGVAASKFSSCLGFEPANKALGVSAFVLWLGGLTCRVLGWLSYFDMGMAPRGDGLYRLGAALLFLGALAMTVSLRVFDPVRDTNPSQKFIRSAFVWLLVAGVMLVGEPLRLSQIGMPFSHAYIGAIRHAVTVGFISQMILGVGLHAATRFRGVPVAAVSTLGGAWFLINAGNTGRVVLEVLTDTMPAAFQPMGMTGFVELVGLALWANVMLRLLVPRKVAHVFSC